MTSQPLVQTPLRIPRCLLYRDAIRRRLTPTRTPRLIAFLFLGETLLIPHLYPIVEAVADEATDLGIECWCATSVHEDLLFSWLGKAGLLERVRVRRAPGFVERPGSQFGQSARLPSKLPMLLRLAPHLLRARVVVCAEQTSLWIPTLLPMFPARFVKTSHGVGSMSARDDRRRRAAYRMLLPSEREKATYTVRRHPCERLVVTGYVKSCFRPTVPRSALFADDKPVVVYAPHWQRHRSSWWTWGSQIVAMLAEQHDWNVILAPHQRLSERDPEVVRLIGKAGELPHVHADHDSFSMVDGTYMAAADLYLGDTSSQVMEFLERPRPCVFLNPQKLDWTTMDDHDFWRAGDVVDGLSDVLPALRQAVERHPDYEAVQLEIAGSALGDTSGKAASAAARAVLDAARP